MSPEIPADQPAPPQQPADEAAPPNINLEELARKVFELLLRELQLENDRTGRH
jgi:hypothetical protein